MVQINRIKKIRPKRLVIDIDNDTHTIIKVRAHNKQMTVREYVTCAIIEKMNRELGYGDCEIIEESGN